MKKTYLLYFALFFPALRAYSYTEFLHIISLNNGNTLALFGDNYRDFSSRENLENAEQISLAIKNLSAANQNQVVDFSFEDPGLYSANYNLASFIKANRFSEPNSSFAVLSPMQLPELSYILPLNKSADFTTMLSGDLIFYLNHYLKTKFPANLFIHSNDPRPEHLAAVLKDGIWLTKHSQAFSPRSFILPQGFFQQKVWQFEAWPQLSEHAKKLLDNELLAFKTQKDEALEKFIAFAKDKNNLELKREDLSLTLNNFDLATMLPLIHDFILQNSKVFHDLPILDTLMSLLHKDASNRFFVCIMNKGLARSLEEKLQEMELVEKSEPKIPEELIANFANL